MHTLLVHAHPDPESFSRAVREAAVAALEAGGHEVTVRDLHAVGFDPVMSREERRTYHTPGANETAVADDLALLKAADALVFVYPTWWFGLPAILKGWLDRVLVPHATFDLPTASSPMRPKLTNIRRITAITTCGATYLQSKFVGEPGRKTLLRGIRWICAPDCKTRYLSLYRMDSRCQADRERFLGKISRDLRDP